MVNEHGGTKVVESGTNNGWEYKKYSDGTYEAWFRDYSSLSLAVNSSMGNVYRSNSGSISFPSFSKTAIACWFGGSSTYSYSWSSYWISSDGTYISFVIWSPTSVSSHAIRQEAYVYGTY